MTIAETVKEKVDALPVEKQQEVLAFTERIAENGQQPRPLHNPEGILAGLVPDLTLEDFQKNRREMWGTATDRELEWPK